MESLWLAGLLWRQQALVPVLSSKAGLAARLEVMEQSIVLAASHTRILCKSPSQPCQHFLLQGSVCSSPGQSLAWEASADVPVP